MLDDLLCEQGIFQFYAVIHCNVAVHQVLAFFLEDMLRKKILNVGPILQFATQCPHGFKLFMTLLSDSVLMLALDI